MLMCPTSHEGLGEQRYDSLSLAKKFSTMIATHLSDNELADVVSGRLPADRFERLMLHLDDCQTCQQRVSASDPHDSFAGVLAAGAKENHDPILAEADCQAAIFHAAAPSATRMDRVLPPIEMLGAYRLIRPLGRGGMGAVYLAQHGRLRKHVAIKLLPRQFGFDATWIGRFEREMQAVANLSHRGIVTATDAGDVDGWHYLVMEYLDGLDLAAIIGRVGPIDAGVAASVMRDVCDALASVHQAGLVHRDIKPSNIMLTRDGSVKLLDLGLVLDQKASIADLRLTTVGHVIGTLAFAAPEQLSDQSAVDARVDLYAVGVTLFQLVTGRTPHSTQHGIAPLVIEKTSKPAASLRSLAPDAPVLLDELVRELLERDPADRPARAEDVARRLNALATDGKVKSLVGRATRVPGDESLTDASLRFPMSLPPKPPRRRGWKWLAEAGFPIGLLVLATVITIQMGQRTVRIETDDPDIKVAIADSELTPSIASPVTVEKAPPQKLYKGKTLGEWTEIMVTERDVDTLVDAMNAVASLVDADDVEAAHSILVAARRFGGWFETWSQGETPTSSEQFMHTLIENVEPLFTPRPGFEAIAIEIVNGNEKSRAAAVWLLLRFSQRNQTRSYLRDWAREPENRVLATHLHQNLKNLLKVIKLKDEKSRSYAKVLSLELAIALDTNFEDEAQLREDILRIIADSQSMPSLADRSDQRISTGNDPIETSSMTPQQFVAATRLGIELPVSLIAAFNILSTPDFRDAINEACLAKLDSDPQEMSDALLMQLYRGFGTMGKVGNSMAEAILVNQPFWIEALPIVTEQTTRPDIMYNLSLLQIEQSSERSGMGGGFDGISNKLSEALTEVLKACSQRLQERMEAESMLEIVLPTTQGLPGGMF